MAFMISINLINVNAIESNNDLTAYNQLLDELNDKYHAKLYILDEEEFINSPIYDDYEKDYANYIHSILSIDISSFKSLCLETINIEKVYNVQIIHNSRSTKGTKTMLFNNGNNIMTLIYKYRNTYDTSYTLLLLSQK